LKPLTRLLVVANTDVYVAVHMRDFLRRLQEAQVKIHVLSPGGTFVHDLQTRGMEWTELPLARGRRGVFSASGAFTALRRTQRRIHPELTLAVTAAPVLLEAMAATISPALPFVGVIPGLGHFFAPGRRGGAPERGILRTGFRWAARRPATTMVFQLAADRRRIIGERPARTSRTEVIPGWGVDLKRFAARAEARAPLMTVMISRLLWEKGVGDFVEAARALRAAGSTSRFVLVGETDPGNPSSIPAKQLELWNAEGAVEWWGRREDIPSILEETSVLALPTKYGEGVPRVLVEAGAAGVPVVAGDVPGSRSIVDHGVNGLVVPPGNPVELAAALQKMLENTELRLAMGAANRLRIEEHFDVELVVARYRQVFSRFDLDLPRDRQS
jgi:hypothetical protein